MQHNVKKNNGNMFHISAGPALVIWAALSNKNSGGPLCIIYGVTGKVHVVMSCLLEAGVSYHAYG